jgi:hypothetical protein
MKETRQKSLRLNKETLRQLQPDSLALVAGGVGFPTFTRAPTLCPTVVCPSTPRRECPPTTFP